MPSACARCPCADTCLRWPSFCEWAAEDPPDPVKLRHICARSAMPARPVEYPPLAQQAANLGRDLFDWAVSGFSMSSDEEVERRTSLCMACEQWDAGRCRICGCALAAKIRLRTSHCPLPVPRW